MTIHLTLDDTSFPEMSANPPVRWVCDIYTVHKNRYKFFMNPGAPPLQSTRLLDQVHERIRYLHCSLETEKPYLYWIRFFIRWSANQQVTFDHQLCRINTPERSAR